MLKWAYNIQREKFMRRIFISILEVFAVFIFQAFVGCGSNVTVPPEGYTYPPSIYDDYVITQNGNINDENDLTTEAVDAEYSTFLLPAGDIGKRDIFIGGLMPNNASIIDIECSSLYTTHLRKYIKTLTLFGHTYYFADFNILSNFSPTNATLNAKLLDINDNQISQKQFTIKVAPENAMEWGLRVYQQESYN
jgi:hypothetical protein